MAGCRWYLGNIENCSHCFHHSIDACFARTNGSTNQNPVPASNWTTMPNAASYQGRFDNNADFSSPEFDDTAETTTRELATPLENGSYYWRVRAIKADDTLGEWSLVWSFRVNVP